MVLGMALAVATVAGASSSSAAATRVKHAFKLVVSPEYTTAGQPTTFQVTVANTSSRGISLGSVQLTPPAGFRLSRTVLPSRLKRKTLVQQRMVSLRQISVKPGAAVQLPVTAVAPKKCGTLRLRWSSRAFEGGNGSGPQLALQSTVSSVGVTVLCPAASTCGAGGPRCSTSLNTSQSSYAVLANATSGTLRQTVNVGRRLTCRGYKLRDPNWYDSLVSPSSSPPPAAGAVPVVNQVTYTIRNTTPNGIGFCLGATYDFKTASGRLAPKGVLPNGRRGFIGLLPLCSAGTPPCISRISSSQDPHAKTGMDTTLNVLIPEGDPWGGG
jgi:hypothetical protein